MLIFTKVVAVVVSSFFILGSYVQTGAAIAHTHAIAALWKALSACSYHILVVLLLYGPVIRVHLRPSSCYDLYHHHQVTTFYTVVTPMLNPLIYSPRNQEVKDVLRRLFRNLHLRKLPAGFPGNQGMTAQLLSPGN